MRSPYIALVAAALLAVAGSGQAIAAGMMDTGRLLAFQSESGSGLAALPTSPDDTGSSAPNRLEASAGESAATRPGQDSAGGSAGDLLPTGEPAPPAVDTPRRSGHRWQSLVPGAIK